MRIIMGIEVSHREEDAIKVQKLLTDHGCSIKTRLGLHEAGNICSSTGLLLLEFAPGTENDVAKFEEELSQLSSVKYRKMEF